MPKLESKTLLSRQLKKHGFNTEVLPSQMEEWTSFLARIENTYQEFNDSRIRSENILDVSLREMKKLELELSESNQKKLKEMNEYLKLILQATELGTWDWDLNTNTVHFDQRWCEILGYEKSELIHDLDTFKSLVNPEQLEDVLKNAGKYISSNKEQKYEARFQMKHRDGHWVDILAKGKIINFDSNGKPIRFIGTHLDISEELRLQNQLEKQKISLLRTSKLASLGEMSAGIAHEINNPLAIISAVAEVLPFSFENRPIFDEKIEKIKKAITRISKIVKGLKKFSRSESTTQMKIHCLDEIVEESLILTESKAKSNFTQVILESAGSHNILCDENEIEQVMVNLIQNAIDAVKTENEKWVKISIHSESSKVILRVIDSGHGISPEVEQKLFEPFFTTKTIGEGTGLGLSITKGIVDDHQGTIFVNRGFKNTCFEIQFNLASVGSDPATQSE